MADPPGYGSGATEGIRMRLRRLLLARTANPARLRSRIAAHPLLELVLDEAWYLARYPDVLNAGLGARDHFLDSGVHEWRSPSPYVDLRFAAEHLPQERRSGSETLLHLLEAGIGRGLPTSPYVDLAWYGRAPGLTDATHEERFTHLLQYGRELGLDPSPWVDLSWYRSRHPEIRLGGLDPFEYFLAVGRWLQRFPHPAWDEDRYIGLNDYVRTAVGSRKYTSGFEHFCAVGWEEAAREAIALPLRIAGREDEFSESRYRSANPDVDASIRTGDVRSGLEHLMTVGHHQIAEGVRILKHPSPFSSATVETTQRPPRGEWLVLLNHYDPDGRIDPHVETAIDAYCSAGADVVLITTDADEASRHRIAPQVTHIITKSRNDDLRDFGGWHHALDVLPVNIPGSYSRVVLTNDSVYFPVRSPERLLGALRTSEADIVAATDSVSGGRYHLQSYFLALGPRAVELLRPELARRVAEQAEGTKLTLIQRFEVGLSDFAISSGLTTEVLLPLRAIPDLPAVMCPPDLRVFSRLAATVLNVTHHFWRTLLAEEVPFLKVELLRDNPVDVDLSGWEDLVDGPCDARQIHTHLARVTGGSGR